MKQNGRIQSQIISMVTSLVEMKLMEEMSKNKDERFCIVETVNFKEKTRQDEYGFIESYIILKEKPKEIVNVAKRFVDEIKKNNQVEFYNRAMYYYPHHTMNCEIGIIDYFELLFKKL
mgnify:CR=1 FL=1